MRLSYEVLPGSGAPDGLGTTVARQQGLRAETGHCRLTVTRLQALLPVLSIQGEEMVPEPWASGGRGDQAGPGIRSCPSEQGSSNEQKAGRETDRAWKWCHCTKGGQARVREPGIC